MAYTKFKRKKGSTNNQKIKHKKVIVDGIEFDSKLESQCYPYLRDWQNEGIISNLELQPLYLLIPAFKNSFYNGATRKISSAQIHKMEYTPDYQFDFVFDNDTYKVVIESKGYPNESYPLRKKIFLDRFRNVVFLDIRKKEDYPKILDIVEKIILNDITIFCKTKVSYQDLGKNRKLKGYKVNGTWFLTWHDKQYIVSDEEFDDKFYIVEK